jgi:hypothetical protein
MHVGDQLRWLHNATDDSGRPLNWRDTRRNRVVFLTHPGRCAACSSYAHALLDIRDGLQRWDGDIWLVGDIAESSEPSVADVTRVTGDGDHRLRRGCGLSADDARVVVADRWGQIWQTAVADERHTLVDPADLLETTKFIAIQCPECETLDQPTGDWSNVH